MKKVLAGIGIGLVVAITAFMAYIAVVVARDGTDMFDKDDWLD